ncbi:uncharacterized protein LOC103315660 [Nasonia vitripennis]|uniref:PID domain-containing protein n=1 Tax=Nasonia vitripennis TaxID=7425 RepID=A0A7M7IQQ7_NASVI|nr:uncharacterized protein LOC103315660 [Nasonia vitripennis]
MRGSSQESSTPYCRCRVLYLGSSVPHASKEGLLGVQEPLRELYPEQGALGARGIDSWLSVWSNGLLLENVDEHRKKVTRFFPIEALHYCAAVRHVKAGNSADSQATRFFPLDSPFARTPSANHPPLFAAVLRRTTGIKVLECHAFICKRDMAANALVRCCFHAYADSRFAKGLEPNGTNGAAVSNGQATPTNGHSSSNGLYHTLGGSSTTLAENNGSGGSPTSAKLDTASNDDGSSLYNGDENHKVWARGRDEIDGLYQEQGTLRSTKGSRPRQLIAPPPPPPPPPQQPLMHDESNSSSSRKKASKKLKKLKNRSLQDEQQHHFAQQLQMQQAAMYTNGHGHHTLGHPIRQPPPHGYHPMAPGSRSVAGTLARPGPVLLVPAATLPRKAHHHPARGIRPIPAAAPIVPIYAPLPVVPPPPAGMYPGGYGTTGNRGRRHHPDAMDSSTLGLQQRRMAASHADLSVPPPPPQQERSGNDSPDNESRFGTGIYRRKGHLNERAFSYSIRAEHRSRSHGSLASLGFAGQNGLPPKEEKKDREIAQMVAGLSLDDGSTLMLDPRILKNGNGAAMAIYGQHPQPLPRPRPR